MAGARRLLPAGKRRDSFLSVFGPLSLPCLFILWAVGLIAGFALLHLGLASPLNLAGGSRPSYPTLLYLSGETFFTLGYGDVTAASPAGRLLSVAEAGLGFGFMAVIIGYLPVLYQAFSRREVAISLLDARAGSPPSAAQLLLRLAAAGGRRRRGHPPAGRVGALVGRAAGEPPVVSRAQLLPLAARQPVVAGGPDRRSSTPPPCC